jgi:hypothetical protein
VKRRAYIIIIAFTVILLALASNTGCGCLQQACQPYGPRATGDGAGGAIAVYEDIKSNNQHDFYVQKISPGGEALWGEKGVLVGSAYKECDSFHELDIVSDGSGGAFIVWSGYPSEPDWKQPPGQRPIEYLTHVTRVDTNGNIVWQREVIGVDHMMSDGAGGILIASDENYEEGILSIIKIDSGGNFPWAEEGVSIHCEDYSDHTLGLTSDGEEGAIIIWQERKGEPDERVSQIFTQRVDAEGSLPWGQDGVLLYTTPEGAFSEEPKIISDGSGGAIAVWMQLKGERKKELSILSSVVILNDIYVQRVDSGGNVLWVPDGVPINGYKGGAFPHNIFIVSDNAGGAIIFLWGGYAQKIGAGGKTEWQPGGVEVITSSLPSNAISDGSGGVIVTFGHKESGSKKSMLYVQKIDATGITVWPGTGTMVTEQGTHDIAYDGQGGAIIAWGSGKSMFSSEKSYVQRVSAEGELMWGDEGIRLNP